MSYTSSADSPPPAAESLADTRSLSEADPFYAQVLNRLTESQELGVRDSVLAVCADDNDAILFRAQGFEDVTIANLDSRIDGSRYAPFTWMHQDVEDLTVEDNSFDVVAVHWGLHHCYCPQQAIREMYRVARKGVLLFEPNDSWLTRLGARAQFGQQYETAAVFFNDCRYGGVANSHIPNFVYRFSRHQLEQTIRALAPHVEPRIQVFYDLGMPDAVKHRRRPLRRILLSIGFPLLRLGAAMAPSIFANRFAAYIAKPHLPDDLQPWLELRGGEISVNRPHLDRIYQQADA